MDEPECDQQYKYKESLVGVKLFYLEKNIKRQAGADDQTADIPLRQSINGIYKGGVKDQFP